MKRIGHRFVACALLAALAGAASRGEGSLVRAWETTIRGGPAARRDHATSKARVLLDGSLMVVGTEAAGLTATRFDAAGNALGAVVLPLAGSSRTDVDPFGAVAAVGTWQGREAIFLFDGISGVPLWDRPFTLDPRPGSADVLLRPRFAENGDVFLLVAYGPAFQWDLAVFRLARAGGAAAWGPAVLSVGTTSHPSLDHFGLTPAGDVAVAAWSADALFAQVFDGNTGAARWPAAAEFRPPGGGTGVVVDAPGADRAGNVFVTSHAGLGLGMAGNWTTVGFDAASGAVRWSGARPDRPAGELGGPRSQVVDAEGRVFVAGEGATGIVVFSYSPVGVAGPEIAWPAPYPYKADSWELVDMIGYPNDELLLVAGAGSLWAARVALPSGSLAWTRQLTLSYRDRQLDQNPPQVSVDPGGTVAVTSVDGTTAKLVAATGESAWPGTRSMDGSLPLPAVVKFLGTRPNGDAIVGGESYPFTAWRLEAATGAGAGGWPAVVPDTNPRRMAVDSKGDVAVLASTGAPKVVVAKLDGATGAAAWPAPVPLADMEITADLLLVAAEASADFVVAGRNALGIVRIVKLRGTDGQVLWSVTFGPPGPGGLAPRALAVDALGDVTLAATDPYWNGDALVMKFRGSDGAALWPSPLAIPGASYPGTFLGLGVDGSGAAFVASGVQVPSGGGFSWVSRLWKLAGATGSTVWTRDLEFPPLADALAVGANGDVTIGGTRRRLGSSTSDYAITRLSGLDGTPVWPQPFEILSSPGVTLAARVLLRPNGNAVVHATGSPSSTWELDGATGSPAWGPLPGEEYESYSELALAPDGVTAMGWSDGLPKIVHFTTSLAVVQDAAGLPRARCGASYAFRLGAQNGAPPLAWSVASGALPPGIELDPSGLLAGSTSAVGTWGFRLRVRDARGAVAERDATLDVVCDGRVAIAGAGALPCGAAGTLSVPGTWSSVLWLPGGETTPTLRVSPAVRTEFGVVVTDANGCVSRGSASLDVPAGAAPVVSAPPGVTAGERGYGASVAPTPGSAYAWGIQGGVITSGWTTNQITFNAGIPGILWLTVVETKSSGCPVTPGYAAVPVNPAASSFHLVTPCRILDTRQPADGPRLRAGETRIVAVPGRCGVPVTARAAAFNVTAVLPNRAGAVVVLPGDAPAATANTVSFGAGQTRAAMSVVALSSDGAGTIAIRNDSPGDVDVVLDVTGWFE